MSASLRIEERSDQVRGFLGRVDREVVEATVRLIEKLKILRWVWAGDEIQARLDVLARNNHLELVLVQNRAVRLRIIECESHCFEVSIASS